MVSDELYLDWHDASKWIKSGMTEVIQRFGLKPPKGYPDYPSYCFVKKNTNRYFRKHLGFTYNDTFRKTIFMGCTTIKILDPKKLMVFRLKYGL